MLLIIILGILAAIVGVACGVQLQKRHFQQEIQNAKATAEKLLNNANEDAKKQSAKIIADGKQQTIDNNLGRLFPTDPNPTAGNRFEANRISSGSAAFKAG